MARCDTTERIAVSPSRVWVLFRPERMREWYGPELRQVSPGPLGKGTRIRVSGRSGVKHFGYEATVTEYADNRTLVWEGADKKASYRIAFVLQPKDGQTVILLRDEFHLKGLLGRIVERFMVRRVSRLDRSFLARLKSLAEQV